MTFSIQDHPHRRLNALTGEWVFVSPHRTQRPWQGKVESVSSARRPAHDPACYLCAGNVRANGERNPDYVSTFSFANDFAAFRADAPAGSSREQDLLVGQVQSGACRVLCFSPRHDLTLADLTCAEIRGVVDLWIAETASLGRRWSWVQVFENKGETMGCSNPHPHGQIWAGDFIPNEPAKEAVRQLEWWQRRGEGLLPAYARLEAERQQRVVAQNEDWIAVVPWWAVWPFETLVLPLRSVARLTDLDPAACDLLADLMWRLLRGYDKLFDCSFPYSMGWHGAPFDQRDHPEWTVHAHFYPPLLRSATVRKFMVGYEMMAESQRDLTPEQAAQRLREACAATGSPAS